MMSYTMTENGRTMTRNVSYRWKSRTVRKVGISPPLKNIVKIKNNERNFRPTRSLRDSA